VSHHRTRKHLNESQNNDFVNLDLQYFIKNNLNKQLNFATKSTHFIDLPENVIKLKKHTHRCKPNTLFIFIFISSVSISYHRNKPELLNKFY